MPDAIKAMSDWLQKWQAIAAVVAAIFTGGIVYASIRGEIELERRRIDHIEASIGQMATDHDRVVRMEATLESVRTHVERIDKKLP